MHSDYSDKLGLIPINSDNLRFLVIVRQPNAVLPILLHALALNAVDLAVTEDIEHAVTEDFRNS